MSIEKMCARGAIQVALELVDENGRRRQIGNDDYQKNALIGEYAESVMLDQIRTLPGNLDAINVPGWNDNMATDVDQVREQMLLAAKNIRNSIEVG